MRRLQRGENKPNGLTVVPPDQVHSFLSPKKVSALFGVGPKTEERLNALNIFLVSDLLKAEQVLLTNFGQYGEELIYKARGIDNRRVKEGWIAKSVGRQSTFERDTKDKKQIITLLDNLIRRVYRDLRSQDFVFKNCGDKSPL